MTVSKAPISGKQKNIIVPVSLQTPMQIVQSQKKKFLDLRTLKTNLKKIESETDETTYRNLFLQLLKEALFNAKTALAEELYETRNGVLYAGGCAIAMDQLISIIYSVAVSKCAETSQQKNTQTQINGMTILAVGGYGRGELAPHSDIDLLFLYDEDNLPKHQKIIEYILYLLWDLGLKVGHATRNIAECLKAASDDVTIMTTLLEVRKIDGDKRLFKNFQSHFQSWLASQSISHFVAQKLQERDARHNQHGATRYMVEPQIKEGKGGLRDLHTLFWIAKFAYKVNSVEEVVERGVLRVSEAKTFASSQRFLWTVRCFLHLRAKREDDRLTFDAQLDLAPLMGFSGRAGLRGVERFMKRYFLAARQVGTLTRIFCSAIESDFENKGIFGLGRILNFANFYNQSKLAPFVIMKNRLSLPPTIRFRQNPELIISLFHHAQFLKSDIHPDTFRRMTRAIKSCSVQEVQTEEIKRLFLEILTAKESAGRVLRLMNDSGFLGKFIPEFGHIVGMMQFDMYHSYTVDEHTIKAVEILNEIETGKIKNEAPLACRLIHQTDARRVLYMAVFLHDIAKGKGGDHSILGAEIAQSLCPWFGFSDDETDTVKWLIRWHLLISKVAFRYDLNNPKTIQNFVADVQSLERLKLLLVLTVADIRAVGPNIWNGWKASLMRVLFHEAERVLGGLAPTYDEDGLAEQEKLRTKNAIQQELNWSDQKIDDYQAMFYPSYWSTFDRQTYILHCELLERFYNGNNPLCLDLTVREDSKSTMLTIITQDHAGLFSRIAGAVAMAGCQIVYARINTRKDGTILDEFMIQTVDKSAVKDADALTRIRQMIDDTLAGKFILTEQLGEKTKSISKRQKAMITASRVSVTNKMSNSHTVLEISGPDRPKLLYDITRKIAQLGLQINSASVSTYGDRAVDVFYVKDIFGMKVETEKMIEKIRGNLLEVLSHSENETL